MFVRTLCPNFKILLIMVNTGGTITTNNLGTKEISKVRFYFSYIVITIYLLSSHPSIMFVLVMLMVTLQNVINSFGRGWAVSAWLTGIQPVIQFNIL